MPNAEHLTLAWNPWLVILVWLPLGMLFGYFARRPVHGLISTVFQSLRLLGRMLSVYCARSGRVLGRWCENLLMGQARDRSAVRLRDAHHRLEERVRRELDTLPILRQRLGWQLSAMEEDFQRSTETPPEAPNWGRVMEAVSGLGEEHDGAVARTLEDIRDTLAQYRSDAREQQRRQHHRRYLLLYRMMPRWRRVQRALEALDTRLGGLDLGLRLTRRRLVSYQRLRQSSRRQLAVLAASVLARFTGGVLLLIPAVMLVAVYVGLVSDPLRSVMGAAPVLPGLPAWAVIAALLVGLQLLLGLLLLDSQRITRVVPALGDLEQPARRGLFWGAFGLLLVSAGAVAAGYYWLAVQTLAVAPLLSLDNVGELVLLGVFGDAALALALLVFPFFLALVAVPLSMLRSTLSPTTAMVMLALLYLGNFLGRAVAVAATVTGRILLRAYDVFIAVPLWLERWWRGRGRALEEGRPSTEPDHVAPAPSLVALNSMGRSGGDPP
ncbi:MAG: hypothetical protein JJT90_04435 [Ectothiorhodospiraceae bacterium]|nr:hypothetical protein [Ectothiorhodospiraceae bacterium]